MSLKSNLTKPIKNTKVHRFFIPKIQIHIQLFSITNIMSTLMFTDLPASTPLVDLSKMADIDMKKLPKVEEAGDRCIR